MVVSLFLPDQFDSLSLSGCLAFGSVAIDTPPVCESGTLTLSVVTEAIQNQQMFTVIGEVKLRQL